MDRNEKHESAMPAVIAIILALGFFYALWNKAEMSTDHYKNTTDAILTDLNNRISALESQKQTKATP